MWYSGYGMATVVKAAGGGQGDFFRVTRWLSPLLVAIALFAAAPAMSSPAADQRTPEQVVSNFNDTLLQVMKSAKQLGYQGRYAALEAVMNESFDFAGMTRAAVRPLWFNMSAAQREALIDAFPRHSIATYATQFDDYSGEQPRLTDRSEPGQVVPVRTVLTPAKGDSIQFR